MAIQRGDLLEVLTASGELTRVRALGEPTRGRDFPVVWVCVADVYTDDLAPGDRGTIPWPLDAVDGAHTAA